jgi:hypothetical protein
MKRKGAHQASHHHGGTTNAESRSSNLAQCRREERKACDKKLKQVTRYAKRDWANKYINEANIWEVAAWRHGRRSSHIPALIDHTGNSHTITRHGDLLSERFFTEAQGKHSHTFPDDPPTSPHAQFPHLARKNFSIFSNKRQTNRLQDLGIGWELLKRGWPHMDELLTNIFTACIRLGHHPTDGKKQQWSSSQTNKTDYSQPKHTGPSRCWKQ